MRMRDWSAEVCSSDRLAAYGVTHAQAVEAIGSVGDIAVDGTELGRGERDRDIFGASILREAVPACAQLEAVLAADDAIIGFGFLGLAGVGDDGDRRRNGEGGERAFEAAVVLHGEVSDSRSEEHTSELQSLMRIS